MKYDFNLEKTDDGWQASSKDAKRDFAIRKEGRNNWVMDIFDSSITDSDKAYLVSYDAFTTFEEIVRECYNYCHDVLVDAQRTIPRKRKFVTLQSKKH